MNFSRSQSPGRRLHKLITLRPKQPRNEERKNTAEFLCNLSDIEKLRASPDYSYLHRYSQHNKALNSCHVMSSNELPDIQTNNPQAFLGIPTSLNSTRSTNGSTTDLNQSSCSSTHELNVPKKSSRKQLRNLTTLDRRSLQPNPSLHMTNSYDLPRGGNMFLPAITSPKHEYESVRMLTQRRPKMHHHQRLLSVES